MEEQGVKSWWERGGWRARCEGHSVPAPSVCLATARSTLAQSHYCYLAGRIPSNLSGVRDAKQLPGPQRLQDSSNPSGRAGFPLPPPPAAPSSTARVSPAARRRPRRLPMAAYSADQYSASGAAVAWVHSKSLSAAAGRTGLALAGGACGTWGRSESVVRDALGAGRVGRASRAEYAGCAVLPGPARRSVRCWSLVINGPLEYY